MVKFQDLPDDIIDLILSYIPNKELEFLFDVPVLGEYLSQLLYSDITIQDSKKFNPKRVSVLKTTISKFGSPDAFINFKSTNSNIFPKKIRFKNAFDAFKMVRMYPWMLEKFQSRT